MKKTEGITTSIAIEQIALDQNNPRNNYSSNQKAALQNMLIGNEEKIFNLARDICEHGQNPTENVSVIWDELLKKYIVLDGNRRVAAIKLALDPGLIELPVIRKKFESLDTSKIPTSLNAILFTSREEARPWILLKHTGENDGVGTVSWNAQQQARFSKNKYSSSMKFITYLEKEKIGSPAQRNTLGSQITSVERLLGDPDFRKALNIQKLKGSIVLPTISEEVRKLYTRFVCMVSQPDFSVNCIRSKNDRTEFTKRLIAISQDAEKKVTDSQKITDENKETNTIVPATDDSEIKNNSHILISRDNILPAEPLKKEKEIITASRRRNRTKTTRDRSTLIPKDFRENIHNTKLRDLFYELQNIDVDSYPNVVGCAFRAFIEITMDVTLSKLQIDCDQRKPLSFKIQAVKSKFMDPAFAEKLSKCNVNKKDIKRQFTELETFIDQFHGYIHSPIVQPVPYNLKTTWNNFSDIFSILMEQTI